MSVMSGMGGMGGMGGMADERKLQDSILDERGRERLRMELCYPSFAGKEGLSAFYEKLARAYEGYLRGRFAASAPVGSAARMTYTVCLHSAQWMSLYVEVMEFTGRTLTNYRRYAQTWEMDAENWTPLKRFLSAKQRKGERCGQYDGYFLCGGNGDGDGDAAAQICLYRNLFRAGDGEGVRRSQYQRFIEIKRLEGEGVKIL